MRSLLPTRLATLLFCFGEPFKMVSVRKLSFSVGQANAASSKTAAADEHGPQGAAPDRILDSTTCVSDRGDAFLDLSAIDRDKGACVKYFVCEDHADRRGRTLVRCASLYT